MFTRVKTVQANGRTYQYVHIVENRWEDGKVRQRIVGSLGRLDELLESGDLERVVKGLVENCPQVKLVRAQQEQSLVAESDRVWGPVLVFERLWEELGLSELFHKLARGRRFHFDVERCAFAIVLQRLLSPGSDLAGSKWIGTVQADGFDRLRLPHFYRTVGKLWKWKERIERHLLSAGATCSTTASTSSSSIRQAPTSRASAGTGGRSGGRVVTVAQITCSSSSVW